MTSPLDTERQRLLDVGYTPDEVSRILIARASSPNEPAPPPKTSASVFNETPAYSRPNFIVRLWRGDVPLVRAYWVYGVLVVFILRIALLTTTYAAVAFIPNLEIADNVVNLIGLLVLVYAVIVMTGVWRSATRYASIKPNRKIWAILAKCAVVFSIIALIASVAKSLIGINEDTLTSNRDEKAQNAAVIAGLNTRLPRKIDDNTTLTKIDFDGTKWQYYYALNIPIPNTEGFSQSMRDALHDSVCADQRTLLSKSNSTVSYIYTGAGGEEATITFTKSDCP